MDDFPLLYMMFFNSLEQFEIYSLFSFINSCIVLRMQDEQTQTSSIPIIIGVGITTIIVSIGIYKLIKKKSPLNDRYYCIKLDNNLRGLTDFSTLINNTLGFNCRFLNYEYILAFEEEYTLIYLHTYTNFMIFELIIKLWSDNLLNFRFLTEHEALKKFINECSFLTIQNLENPERIIYSNNELKTKCLQEADRFNKSCQPS
jgi:hypothetical protein